MKVASFFLSCMTARKTGFLFQQSKKCLQLKVVPKWWFTRCYCVWLLDVLQDEEW